MRRLVLSILLLSLTAFAGRPVYLCLMENKVAAAPKPSCHTAKTTDPAAQHETPAHPESGACMVDAGSPLAPAVEPFTGPAVIAVVIGELFAPRLLVAAAAPAELVVLRFESPPNSIDILRI